MRGNAPSKVSSTVHQSPFYFTASEMDAAIKTTEGIDKCLYAMVPWTRGGYVMYTYDYM